MKLQRFRMTNFRSVEDSGWIDVEDITALVGTNESGKTNLLVPLWKLNPVRDGEINALADYPRKRYNEIRNMKNKPTFVRAQFELSEDLAAEIAELTESEVAEVKTAVVSRNFDGRHVIGFPNARPIRDLPAADVAVLLAEGQKDVAGMEAASKAEEALKEQISSSLGEARELAEAAGEAADEDVLSEIKKVLDGVDTSEGPIDPR